MKLIIAFFILATTAIGGATTTIAGGATTTAVGGATTTVGGATTTTVSGATSTTGSVTFVVPNISIIAQGTNAYDVDGRPMIKSDGYMYHLLQICR
jgi:hypothetical protein